VVFPSVEDNGQFDIMVVNDAGDGAVLEVKAELCPNRGYDLVHEQWPRIRGPSPADSVRVRNALHLHKSSHEDRPATIAGAQRRANAIPTGCRLSEFLKSYLREQDDRTDH
jgi:hypothetical protein